MPIDDLPDPKKHLGKMRSNQFFRKVWRVNALVILFAGILGLGLLAFTTIYALREIFRDREVTAVVNTGEDQKIREVLSLAQATQIAGQPWLLVAVESDQKYDQSYYSKSAVAARNYAFVTASGPPRWLYPHNRFLIVDASQLPAPDYSEKQTPTAVVRADSDGDKRLTPSDVATLVFTKPDGTESKAVVENVRKLVTQELMGEQVIVLYEGASGYGKAVISSGDFSRVSIEAFELPK
jgi:hypothetical protein